MKAILATLFGFALLAPAAHAQTLYVTQSNQISAFDATTGAVINLPLITGLDSAVAVAIAGTDLLAVYFKPGGSPTNSNIGLFTSSGAAVQTPLISGLDGAFSAAVSGGNIYVVNAVNATVGEYTTSGAPVNASLIRATAATGVTGTSGGLAVLGNHLFLGVVVYSVNGWINEYDATTGGLLTNLFIGVGGLTPALTASGNTIYAVTGIGAASGTWNIGAWDATTGAVIKYPFVTNLYAPVSLAVNGNDLFVLDSAVLQNGTLYTHAHVGRYNAATGAAINTNLVDMGMGVSANGIAIGPQMAPVTPAITSPACAGGTLSFQWTAISNAAYQVQYSTNLLQTNWMNLGSTLTATNTFMSSSYAATNQQGFYRIMNQPNGQ
ncbi:MAG: hypothetical protein ABSD29_15885 [Verrucomicrobiota bacterium]|jgi:hypothetical protein